MNRELILLIGMPGAGKSTIGKILASRLGYDFYDMDIYIQEVTNKSIKELFAISEEYFRDWESKACIDLSKRKRTVIASGGGIVKRKENIDVFKDVATIIYIDRSVENILNDIRVDSRPLLMNGKSRLYNLYKERQDLYNKYCHYKIENKGTLDEVLENIIEGISNPLSSQFKVHSAQFRK